MARMWGSYASSFSTSLKMMFANAGVIYKALGIPREQLHGHVRHGSERTRVLAQFAVSAWRAKAAAGASKSASRSGQGMYDPQGSSNSAIASPPDRLSSPAPGSYPPDAVSLVDTSTGAGSVLTHMSQEQLAL